MLKSRVKEIRAKLGISQVELAAHAGISIALVNRLQRGDVSVKLETLMRVALALGVAVADLYPEMMIRPKRRYVTERRLKTTHSRVGKLAKENARLNREAAANVVVTYQRSGK